MNNDRRKTIDSLIREANDLKGQIDSLQEQVEAVLDEEREYFDNMPESLQQGERGQAAEEAVSALEEAANMLGDFCVDDLTGYLEGAKG